MKIKNLIVISFSLFLFGCPIPVMIPPEIEPKAAKYEEQKDIQRALYYWEIVAASKPADQNIAKKIAELKKISQDTAQRHFEKGVELYEKHSYDAAQKQFLIALRYNPDHMEALEYLKNKLQEKGCVTYEIKSGDTFEKIAEKIYKDPEKAFVIASLNGLNPNSTPPIGKILRIPIISKKTIKPVKSVSKKQDIEEDLPEDNGDTDIPEPIGEIESLLRQAQRFFKAGNYEKVLPLTEQILEQDYVNKEAGQLANAAYYELGMQLYKNKSYAESLKMLYEVDKGYKDVDTIVSDIKKQIKYLAEEHYKQGVKFYVDEKIAEAIQEWEKTLSLDPEHNKAETDIENAQKLLEKLKQIK